MVGRYIAYSWAWSPPMLGMLIRGLFTVDQVARGTLRTTYDERLPQAALRYEGPLVRHGQGLVTHLDLLGGGGGESICAHLLVAGWPAGVLCGHFVGMVVHGNDARRAVSRVAMLRTIVDNPWPEPYGYVEATSVALSADLAQLGFAQAVDLGAQLVAFLEGAKSRADYVTTEDCAALAERLVVSEGKTLAPSRIDS